MDHDGHPAFRHFVVFQFFILLGIVLLVPSRAFPKKEHLVYFPNSAYELNVYKIYGKKPGKTLLLIGGIQGNEPGGFLSADLYADMSLQKGNLIVVPRANFYSILMNHRGPHGDMNRKFTHEDMQESMEDRIVQILKKLIEESDYLLNLHDGSGYYNPRYIDKWRNPMRFGQSIIADYEIYRIPGTDRVIKLGQMARKVISEVNPHIQNPLYKFHFNNTRTADPDSPHKEQRKSATFYALTKHHIPAFGVETSKFLPSIDLKVRHHNMVINAFMRLFDIVPEYPGFALEPPVLKYLVVSINGKTPIVVNRDESIQLHRGDSINVSHIESNYERGLSLDILNYGDLNDFRKDFAITRDTAIIIRKDNQKFAEIPVRVTDRPSIGSTTTVNRGRLDYLVIETRGYRVLLRQGEILDLVEGDHLRIIDVYPEHARGPGLKVNFKGFVGNKRNNTGEDRGYDINTSTDLMRRYSLKRRGRLYEIIASIGGRSVGRFLIRLNPPRLEYLALKVNDRPSLLLRSGDTLRVSEQDRIRLETVGSNIHAKGGYVMRINGHLLRPGESRTVGVLLAGTDPRHDQEAMIMKGSLLLGKIHLKLHGGL